jgi:flagellin-specific chaperone FliS
MLKAREAIKPRILMSESDAKALEQLQARVERQCLVCQSDKVLEINDKLKAGVSSQKIANAYGLGYPGIRRHARIHLMIGVVSAEHHPTLQRLEELYKEAKDLLVIAKDSGDAQDASRALTVVNRVLDTIAKVRGDLNSQMGGGIKEKLGVGVDHAKRAVAMMARSEASNEHEIAKRAQAFLEAYNKRWPDRARRVRVSIQRTSSAGMIESTGAAALADGAEVNSTQGLVPQEDRV